MSVYKEGYYAIREIEKRSVQIYRAAADFGAPVRKGDKLWNLVKQLVDWYGDDGTREHGAWGVSIRVSLMNEHGDGSIEKYAVSYCKAKGGHCKGYDGYVNVTKIK